jgi:glycosyltransferase involved in cell wall biosynthesis
MYAGVMDEHARAILGTNFVCLNKTGRYDFWSFFRSYITFINSFSPDVIYAHIGEMNLFSLWAKPFLRQKTRVVWCVHSAFIDYKSYGKVFQAVFWLQKAFSRFADKVIYVSNSAKEFHLANGYSEKNSAVVPNGIDTQFFTPNIASRDKFRASLNANDSTKIIGIAARIDRMKGYELLSRVAVDMMDYDENLLFVCAGAGDENIKNRCIEILGKYSYRFAWLGFVDDLREFYNGIDVFVLPSYGEAFGLTVVEAMSCGKIAVVSTAGEMRRIVNDDRFVFEIGSESGLKIALSNALAIRDTIDTRSVAERYDIQNTIKKTLEEVFEFQNSKYANMQS